MRASRPLAPAVRTWATAVLASMVALTPGLVAAPWAAADPSGLGITATIPVGSAPWGLGITPDGKRAYVANSGSTDDRDVSVIDIATQTVIATVALDPSVKPEEVMMAPDGSEVWVLSYDTISIVDTSTNTVRHKVFLDYWPGRGTFTSDGKLAYIPRYSGHDVVVMDTATREVIKTIDLWGVGGYSRPGSWSVALTPDGKSAYVANYSSKTVNVIDTATNEVDPGVAIPVGSRPSDIAITPDGSTAYVANGGENTLSVIDLKTRSVTALDTSIDGQNITRPNSVAITADGRAFVTNGFDSSVSVIDTQTQSVTQMIRGDLAEPYDVALTPDGSAAYVTNIQANTVSVISIPQPVFAVDRQDIAFGDQDVNSTSTPEQVTVTNTGVEPLSISDVSLGGTDAADFALGGTDCTTAALLPAESCTVDVSFAPTSGGAKSATLDFTDNAAGSPHTVALSGTAIGAPAPDPTTQPDPAPSPTSAGTRKQRPADGRGIPPKRVNGNGLTVIQRKNAVTNAGQRIRTLVSGQPMGSSIAGETRSLRVIRGPKGKVSVRTYGTPVRIVVRQRAAATDGYLPYQRKTVYVTG